MKNSLFQHGFVAAAALLVVVSIGGGVMYLLGHLTADTGGTAMRVGVGTVLIVSGLAMSAGIWISRRSHRGSGGLIVPGAAVAAVCFWWTGVVPAVAVPVAFFGIRRARRRAMTSTGEAVQ
jgi:cytochrome c biogenesis protein CcdA